MELQTITFYSYKGGTGRSLLLSNMACFLAGAGHKVAMLDFDMEAPGLHLKFLRTLPDAHTLKTPYLSRGEIKGDEVGPGTVDIFAQWQGGRSIRLDDYLYDVTATGLKNVDLSEQPELAESLWLIPAGPAPSAYYARRLESLVWPEINRGSRGGIADLKQQLRDKGFSYLLIDARTGITDVSTLALYGMADKAVCLFTSTPESVRGAALVMKGIAARLGSENVIPTLSRTPPELLNDEAWFRLVIDGVNDRAQEEGVVDGAGQFCVTRDSLMVVRSDALLQAKEEILVGSKRRLRDSMIILDYLALFGKLGLPDDIFTPAQARLLKLYEGQPASMQPLEPAKPLTDKTYRKRRTTDPVYSEPSSVFKPEYRAFISSVRRRAFGDTSEPRSVNLAFDLMALQMHDGLFHFCSDPFYMTATRRQLVGILPLGWVTQFGCWIDPFPHVLDDLLDGRDVPLRFEETLLQRLAEKTELKGYTIGLLGETAASSEVLPHLGECRREKQVFVAASSGDLRDWIGDQDCKAVIADADVLAGIGRRPQLHFEFTSTGPNGHVAGLVYPQRDTEWRRSLALAIAGTLTDMASSTGMSVLEEWHRAREPLRSVGIDPLSGVELLRELLLDLDTQEAIDWHQKLLSLTELAVDVGEPV